MSVSSDTTRQYQCNVCKTRYEAGDGYDHAENICSEWCYLKDKGQRALHHVQNDHRHCSSCGKQRATVELPKPDEAFAIDESYDGAFCVDDGEVTYEAFGQTESAKAAIGFRYPTPAEKDGSCECGQISRTGDGHFDVLGAIETDAILLRLRKRIKEAAIDGQREDWPSKGDLLRHYEQTEDLAYAVGASL